MRFWVVVGEGERGREGGKDGELELGESIVAWCLVIDFLLRRLIDQ